MKLIASGCMTLLLSLIPPHSTPQAGTLDEHLRFLEPLLGTEWVGGYVGPEAPALEIVLGFSVMLDGRVVEYVREAAEADFSSVTQFFWNPAREEICFLSLDNRGTVGEGVVSVVEGKIVLLGQSHRSDGTIEFKTTWEVDANGNLTDTFQRMEDGRWVQGHLQQFARNE
jgi:hypothetical protein